MNYCSYQVEDQRSFCFLFKFLGAFLQFLTHFFISLFQRIAKSPNAQQHSNNHNLNPKDKLAPLLPENNTVNQIKPKSKPSNLPAKEHNNSHNNLGMGIDLYGLGIDRGEISCCLLTGLAWFFQQLEAVADEVGCQQDFEQELKDVLGVKHRIIILIAVNEKPKRTTMKDQSKKPNRDPIIINVKKLAENVLKAQSKNLSKLNQILQLNPNFDYKPFKPSIPSYETREELSLAQQIMMRQIDRLMEDEQKLNIELDRNQIKQKEQERKIQREIMFNMDHFTFLRKLWKRDQGKQRSDGRVDKLIHNVGAIKGHILNLIKRENNINESPPEIRELVLSSPEYCELAKKYENLRIESQMKSMQEKQENTNNTSESSIESEDTRKQNEQLESELAKLKLELLNKNNELQRLKRVHYSSLTEANGKDNSETSSGLEYQIISSDRTYQIIIRDLKGSKKEIILSDPSPLPRTPRSIQCKQTLQQILKFFQTPQTRRPVRTSIAKPRPTDLQARPKKFTVEQIARPKFISNRQITPIATLNAPQA